MAALNLPDDVAAHIRAAIQLSNRRLHLRLLDEAEQLAALDMPVAAIIVASTVLETFVETTSTNNDLESEGEIARWRALRNDAAHHGSRTPAAGETVEMIRGLRRFISLKWPAGIASPERGGLTPDSVRGKYEFVPSSSADFIAKKAEELRLEHQ